MDIDIAGTSETRDVGLTLDSHSDERERFRAGIVGYAIEPSPCKCKSTCQRKVSSGGGCPCKAKDSFCTDYCKCGTKKKPCLNKPPPVSKIKRNRLGLYFLGLVCSRSVW